MAEHKHKVVVVGAGVAGLTTALLLSRKSQYSITVAAKHMPGDYDIEYASPWAGANFMPVSVAGTRPSEWDRHTWTALDELARNHPDAGIHYQGDSIVDRLVETYIYNRAKDAGSTNAEWLAELLSPRPWFANVVPNFREIPKSELGPGIDSGIAFTSVCINVAVYLPWLVSQCLKNGVVFKRATYKHICDAAKPGEHHSGQAADLVVNCTGLSASRLGGVEDKAVQPARGQIVVVRNVAPAMYSISGTDDGEDESCYIMTRAAGGGTILGGCYQKGNWESQPDHSLALRIMKRAVDLCPELSNGKGIEGLDVIRHGVGLRPYREGGARIEAEVIGGIPVVHLYGQGGAGYQSSYGCAQEAVGLVDGTFEPAKAKL